MLFFIVYLLMLCVAGLQLQHYWPLLPDRLATHFDGSGAVNGWMPKQVFLYFYAAFILIMPCTMAGVSWLSFRFLPPKLINIPNRQYWLAPERRAATVKRLTRDMTVFSLISALFIIGVNQVVIAANLVTPPRIDNDLFFAVMGVMAALILGFIVHQYRVYRLPPDAEKPQ